MIRSLAAPAGADDWALARALVEEYSNGLDVDLCFQDLAH